MNRSKVSKNNLNEINIPEIPADKLNENILKKIEVITAGLGATKNINLIESEIAKKYHIPIGTQHSWKNKLRKIFTLPPRSHLFSITSHPQIRQAIAYILTHKERNDKGKSRKGKHLVVSFGNEETDIPLEQFLISTYLQEGLNATATYRALEEQLQQGHLLILPNRIKCERKDIPSIASIRRCLRQKSNNINSSGSSSTEENTFLAVNDRLRIVVNLQENLEKDIESIMEFCKEIHHILGSRHREIVFHRAVEKELKLRSIPFRHESESDIDYKGALIGKNRVDFLTSSGILIEIKAKLNLDHVDCDQAKRYLRSFDGKVCILVNFGSRTIQIKKYSNRAFLKASNAIA